MLPRLRRVLAARVDHGDGDGSSASLRVCLWCSWCSGDRACKGREGEEDESDQARQSSGVYRGMPVHALACLCVVITMRLGFWRHPLGKGSCLACLALSEESR